MFTITILSISIILAFDLTRFAYGSMQNGLYDAAVESFEHLVKKSEEEKKSGIENFDHLFKHKVEPKKMKILLNTAKKAHDHKLDKQGQFGVLRRCNQYPFDPQLRKKKKFKKGYSPVKKRKPKTPSEVRIATQLQVDKLCRGDQLRVISIILRMIITITFLSKHYGPSRVKLYLLLDILQTPQEMANLSCFYTHSTSHWLRLGPMKIEINSQDPAHVVIKDLMSDSECDDITEFLTPLLNFPPGKMINNAKSNDWTLKK